MIILGVALILAGVGLFFASTVLVLRAYPGQRIPYGLTRETMPERCNVLQVIGMLLIVATGFFIARELAPWNFLVMLLAALVQLAMLANHNRKVDSAAR